MGLVRAGGDDTMGAGKEGGLLWQCWEEVCERLMKLQGPTVVAEGKGYLFVVLPVCMAS